MRLRRNLGEGLEVFYNLYGGNWNLDSAKGDLEGKDGRASGSFSYHNNSLGTRGSMVLAIEVRDRGSKRRVSLDFCASTPDDDFPLVLARATRDISPERVDVNYVLDEVEEEIIKPLRDTISSLDFGSIVGAMADGTHGFIGDVEDGIGTSLHQILRGLDSRDMGESSELPGMSEAGRLDLRGKATVSPSARFDGGFFLDDGSTAGFSVDAGRVSGRAFRSEYDYARLTVDGVDVIMVSPESDARLSKNLSKALEKFSDRNFVGDEDLIDSFEELCGKYGFTERVDTLHVD